MRLWCLCAVLVTARLAKVVETLENLGKSLREETTTTEAEFSATKANCSAGTDAGKAALAAFNETLGVLVSAAESAEAKMASLDQALQEKKMELGQVEDLASAEKEALAQTRTAYAAEQKQMEASKQELEKAVSESKDMALVATGSLRRLRKLDSAMVAAGKEAPPSFVQLQEGGADLEGSLDSVRHELEELRADLDAKVAEHTGRLDELHAQLMPLQRDIAKFVPARANAASEKSGAEAQSTDLKRTVQRAQVALKAHADFCAASLGALSTEAELRAEVQNALAGAAETLQSSVFTSLVEKSAAALDIPLTFLQVGDGGHHHHHHHHRDHHHHRHHRGHHHRGPMAFVQTEEETMSAVRAAIAASQPAGADPFADVKARIRSLVDALRSQRNEDVDLATYCSDQEKNFESEAALTKDDVDVQEATAQLHAALEADCASSRDAAQSALSEESARSQASAVNALLAASKADARSKDHELAAQVVGQAQTLVRELFGVAEEAGAFLQQTPSQAGQQAAADQALKEIVAAKTGLKGMVDAHSKSASELSTKIDAVKAGSKAAVEAMQQQVGSLEVQLSGHTDTRLEAAASKKNSEASLAAMDTSRENQRTQCMASSSEGQDSMQRRQEEIASLQDAIKVLDGESVPVGSLLATHTASGKLSPLDAAAYAMGISVRPS